MCSWFAGELVVALRSRPRTSGFDSTMLLRIFAGRSASRIAAAAEGEGVVHQHGVAAPGQFVGPGHAAVVVLLMPLSSSECGSFDMRVILRSPKYLLPPWSCRPTTPGSFPRAPAGFRTSASVGGPYGNCHCRCSIDKPSNSNWCCTTATGVAAPPGPSAFPKSRPRHRPPGIHVVRTSAAGRTAAAGPAASGPPIRHTRRACSESWMTFYDARAVCPTGGAPVAPRGPPDATGRVYRNRLPRSSRSCRSPAE